MDGAGRRVGRRVLDSTGNELEFRGWIYRDLLRPIAEVDAMGNVVARYVYEDGEGARQNGVSQLSTRLGANQDTSLPFTGSNVPELIELLSPSGAVAQRLRLITNQVGTVEAVVDVASRAIVQRLEYDEFGRVLSDSNPGLQPFGFAGGLVDADTGLVRFGARDYAPDLGRWTARDPVLFSGEATSFFSYNDSDPINLSDPTGLNPLDSIKCFYYIWKNDQFTKECKERAKKVYENKTIEEICDEWRPGDPNPRNPSDDDQKCNAQSPYYKQALKSCSDAGRQLPGSGGRRRR